MSAGDYMHSQIDQAIRQGWLMPALSLPRLTALLTALCCSALANAATTPLSTQQCLAMRKGKTLGPDNPVPCTRLQQVTFSYTGFDGRRHDDGRLVVLDAVAPQVQKIMDALLAHGFPLQQAQPMERFNGDDQAAMLANNTSAFNGRAMTGGNGWSKHAYGVAIDINPAQNPYLSRDGQQLTLLPPDATAYIKRQPVRRGMAESVRSIFFRHGFLIWGGNWHQPTDYQHFEIGSRTLVASLLAQPPAAARQTFAAYVQGYTNCLSTNQRLPEPARSDTCAARSKR